MTAAAAPSAQKLVLLVEDDPSLAMGLCDALEFEGFRVVHAARGADAIEQARKHAPDCILLDLMLPDLNGYQVCEQIRRTDLRTPILMLTARGQEADKIRGLDVGADDYVTKPFSVGELLARIRAVLRRRGDGAPASAAPTSEVMRFGTLEIDRNARSVTVAGNEAELTSYQFDLLVAMAERAGRVLTRDQIMEAVRGRELEAFDRSIDVHMGRIRAAIEADVKNPKRILTVRGVGYVFAKQQD